MSRLTSWATLYFGPIHPAYVIKAPCPVDAYDTNAALRSCIGKTALKGAFVSAPSDPAPVVEGDFPVTETIKSMKSSGSSK